MKHVFSKLGEFLLSNPPTVSLVRLLRSYTYNKESFLLKRSQNVFNEIYDSDFWNSAESKSGGGSTLAATKTIRQKLPELISSLSITSMLDIPCGDFNWMKTIKKECFYIGADVVGDIVERNRELYTTENVKFVQLDLTSGELPKVDLVFCKDCLQHLSNESVMKALHNIRRSGSKYLMVTSYPRTWRNHDIYDGDHRPLNLRIKPFSLNNPVLSIREYSKATGVEIDKTMYLFRIDQLNLR